MVWCFCKGHLAIGLMFNANLIQLETVMLWSWSQISFPKNNIVKECLNIKMVCVSLCLFTKMLPETTF